MALQTQYEQIPLIPMEATVQFKSIKVANEFPIARYRLPLLSIRIWFAIASNFEQSYDAKMKFYVYRFSARDIAQHVKISTKKGFTKEVASYLAQLVDADIYIPKRAHVSDEQGHWLKAHFLSSVEFRDGYFEIIIDPKIYKYFFELRSQYSILEIEEILSFGSIHTVKIYMLIKQYINTKTGARPSLRIDELKEFLCLEGKYKNSFSDLRRYVIDRAINEINRTSSIITSYETDSKKGKKATYIIFSGRYKDKKIAEKLTAAEDEVLKALINHGIKEMAAVDLIRTYPLKLIQENLQYAIQKPRKRMAGYIIAAIKENYFESEDQIAAMEEPRDMLPIYIASYRDAVKSGNTSNINVWADTLKKYGVAPETIS